MVAAIVIFLAICVYLLPTIVASARKVRRQYAILALNVLAGWTFVGWVGALVWAIADTPGDAAEVPSPSGTLPILELTAQLRAHARIAPN